MSKQQYTTVWDKRRDDVLERDGYECTRCGVSDPPRGLEVHHVTPMREGGSDKMQNLTTLCWDCHQEVHGKLGDREFLSFFKNKEVPAASIRNLTKLFDRAETSIRERGNRLIEEGRLTGRKDGILFDSPLEADDVRTVTPRPTQEFILVNERPTRFGSEISVEGGIWCCSNCDYAKHNENGILSSTPKKHKYQCPGNHD